MKLHADGGATRIASYGAGYFTIGERIVRHGIIISADGTVTAWPRRVSSRSAAERALLLARRSR